MIQDRRIRTSLVAIFADVVLTFIKAVLAFFTGSAALLADAYHSATDFIVSLILLCGIVIRERQEKKQSEAGIKFARRIESILAIFVALIILYVPFEIAQEINSNESEQIANLWVGILGMLVVIAIVLFMARLKTYVGKETDSIALEADGYHSLVDLFSSIAVLLSLVSFMVGIYIDNLVAILIAVMIGLSGLELLVSGFRSLIKGTDFDQLSFTDIAVKLCQNLPIGSKLLALTERAATGMYKLRYGLLSLLLIGYLASGFQAVPYGYSGLKQQFNESIGEPLAAGLHYRLPWPFGNIVLVPEQTVFSATVGSSVQLLANKKHNLWREIKQNRVLGEETPYLATGDENLIDINFTLHYRFKHAPDQFLLSADLPTLVKMQTEAALWRHAGSHSFNDIMQTSHNGFAERVAESVKHSLAELGIAITLVDAQIQSLQPPAMVVSSYRDVLTAYQEKQQRINRAIAQRLNDLPMASANVIMESALIQANANEKNLIAQGDASRMRQLAEVYKQSPEAFRYNHYIDSLTKNLTDKKLIVVDPAIAQNDIRDWLSNHQSKRR